MISCVMFVSHSGDMMVVDEYCRGKESQRWAVVGKTIKKLDSLDTVVVGVMPSDASRPGCSLHMGSQMSLTCIEWIKECIEFDE